MASADVDRLFAGSIPQLYDEYMAPSMAKSRRS